MSFDKGLALSIALLAPSHPSGSAHAPPSKAATFHAVNHTPIAPPAVVAPRGAREASARDSSAQQRFESRAGLALFSNGPVKGFLGPAIANPHRWNEWEWNDWEAWSAQPFYYGGSFWGPWMLGTIAPALQYGVVTDGETRANYPSYQVESSSPGAHLLADYGLDQAVCGGSNLVVIWGPNNGVACAHPNGRVMAGNYQADPATLTIRAVLQH